MSFCTQKDITEIDDMITTLFSESCNTLGHAEQADDEGHGNEHERGLCGRGGHHDNERIQCSKCYSSCVTTGEPAGLMAFNRSTLPEWAIGLPPISTAPSYQGPVIRGPNGVPTPLLRLKQLDCHLPRTVQVLADSFGFFPANSVCFNDDLTRKVACAMSAYSRIPNSKLNQYICDFQNQWIFFLGALLALTPAPLKCKTFEAVRSTMRHAAHPQRTLCSLFGWGSDRNDNVCNHGSCHPHCPAGWSCVQSECHHCREPCDCGVHSKCHHVCDHSDSESDCEFDIPSLCGSWSFGISAGCDSDSDDDCCCHH